MAAASSDDLVDAMDTQECDNSEDSNNQPSEEESPQNTSVDYVVMTNVDLLHIIFSYVPFTQKVAYEHVCKTWYDVLTSCHNKQLALGNARTKLEMVDRCHNASHFVTKYDIVSKVKLTNPSILVKILRKCPNLKAIAIIDNGEATYKEAVTLPPGSRYDGLHFAHLLDRALRTHAMDELEVHFGRGHPLRPGLRHGFLARDNNPEQATPTTRFVHTPIDRLCSILSQEKCKIECLDLTGLYIDSDSGDGWKNFTDSSSALHLKHLKCSYLDDRDLALILKRCPISEISAIRPTQGMTLNLAPVTLEKVALRSMADPGLTSLSTSLCVDKLRQMFLCNVAPVFVDLMVRYFKNLTHVNLSFAASVTSTATLSKLHTLSDLRHLYLKFKPGMLASLIGDSAFIRILSDCTKLEVLQLVNCPLMDDSLKLLVRCDQLGIFDYRVSPPHVISDVTLTALASLPKLRTCFISCLNTFSETSLIEMLIQSKTIRSLRLHGCRELIPDSNIFFAALKRAKILGHSPLTIDIQIEEEMAITIQKFANIPYNLQFTIRTRNDFYTTKNADPSFLPTGESVDGDFDADVANPFADQI